MELPLACLTRVAVGRFNGMRHVQSLVVSRGKRDCRSIGGLMNTTLPSRRSIFRATGTTILSLLCRLWPRPGPSTVPRESREIAADRGPSPLFSDFVSHGGRSTYTYSSSGKLLSISDSSGKRTYYWESHRRSQSDPAEPTGNQYSETREPERVMPKTNISTVAFWASDARMGIMAVGWRRYLRGVERTLSHSTLRRKSDPAIRRGHLCQVCAAGGSS
jgi:hypothetical protein